MEKKIDRIQAQRARKANKNYFVLLGMRVDYDRLWLWILLFPIYFIYWLYQKVKNVFLPREFDKEKFRKWFEKPRNFKKFIFFWDEKNFSINTNRSLFSSFANKLGRWRKFAYEVSKYLINEYEIEGYEKKYNEYDPDNIEFYKKDNQ